SAPSSPARRGSPGPPSSGGGGCCPAEPRQTAPPPSTRTGPPRTLASAFAYHGSRLPPDPHHAAPRPDRYALPTALAQLPPPAPQLWTRSPPPAARVRPCLSRSGAECPPARATAAASWQRTQPPRRARRP